MSENMKEGKKRDGLYIMIILLLLATTGFLGFKIVGKNKVIEQCISEKSLLEADLLGMEDMLESYVDLEKGNLKRELRQMLNVYDEALAKNDSNADSIEMQKAEINRLLTELSSQKKRSAREIYTLKKETETLRSIMKDYVRQIDSLFQVNDRLNTDLQDSRTQLGDVTSERDQLQERTTNLETKVQTGSRLSAYSIKTAGLKYKSVGDGLKEHTRAGKIDKIRSCFTVSENSLAKSGSKYIYLQVIAPSGKVISSSTTSVVTINGVNTLYTERKEIDYQNQSIDVCIYYDVIQEELTQGNYVVKIFADGSEIGKDSFTLR